MKQPLVSVVMPVYGVERYVASAVHSVLNQTFADFELIVVDDASPDDSIRIVQSIADPRIRVFRHARNRGLSAARNTGLAAASGRYVALLDSDDISPPNRLALQLAAMERDPGLVGCGGWMRYMNADGRLFGAVHRSQTRGERIAAELLFHNTFYVSSMLFRRAAIAPLHYRTEFPMAEDYDFMVRASRIGRLANLGEVLLHYRTHASSLTSTRPQLMDECRRRIVTEQLLRLGLTPTPTELALHLQAGMPQPGASREALDALSAWLLRLRQANEQYAIYHRATFDKVLAATWFESCTKAAGLGVWALRRYASAGFHTPGVVPPQRLAKFFVKTTTGWAPSGARP